MAYYSNYDVALLKLWQLLKAKKRRRWQTEVNLATAKANNGNDTFLPSLTRLKILHEQHHEAMKTEHGLTPKQAQHHQRTRAGRADRRAVARAASRTSIKRKTPTIIFV
jgi:hypothetical protein